jgi:hypothetical protein
MTRGKIWLIGFAVFTAVVAAMIGIALLSGSSEPGLLDDRIQWETDDLPLKVCSHDRRTEDPFALEDHSERALDHAISMTNSRLGFDALTRAGGDECHVVVTFGMPAEAGFRDPGGDASWDNGERLCSVAIVNVSGELETLTVQHELGHCLGLADDSDFEQSIMNDPLVETPIRMMPPWISDHDRTLLRAALGH